MRFPFIRKHCLFGSSGFERGCHEPNFERKTWQRPLSSAAVNKCVPPGQVVPLPSFSFRACYWRTTGLRRGLRGANTSHEPNTTSDRSCLWGLGVRKMKAKIMHIFPEVRRICSPRVNVVQPRPVCSGTQAFAFHVQDLHCNINETRTHPQPRSTEPRARWQGRWWCWARRGRGWGAIGGGGERQEIQSSCLSPVGRHLGWMDWNLVNLYHFIVYIVLAFRFFVSGESDARRIM